jgi:predicted RNase H-like nuclease (RuvC/YqgF family)
MYKVDDNTLPDESRIFIPGRMTDFEENLFLKAEVKELKQENQLLQDRISTMTNQYLSVVPATAYKKEVDKLKNKLSESSKALIAERERGKILLSELDRMRTLFEMSGMKAKIKQNGLNYKKKLKNQNYENR